LYHGGPLPRVGTGNWTTGYVRPKGTNDLIIFMNIGVPGKTGHDFDNKFDQETNTIIWYGKPKTHSGQPTFKKLFSKELTPHFFARWNSNYTKFVYLGTGSIVNFEDGVQTKQGSAIRLVVNCSDAKEILNYSVPEKEVGTKEEIIVASNNVEESSSFLLEKHLESYIEKFWDQTIFGEDFDIYENGRQFPTETGPLDLLAQKKDKSEFLVLELKRDKASDVAVAQTLRYMGYIKRKLATDNEKVRGCIIGTQEDKNLVNAISMVPDLDFYRYNISFSLNRVDF
tara:strand:- start:588 stop:1439 length:852 start_codon:yes stop_codon:yes gene_type:complete